MERDSINTSMEFHLLDPLHDPSAPSSFIDFLGVEMQNISNPWKIEKVLFSTDVGANSSHLHLPKADVEAHILTAMNEETVTALRRWGGPAGLWSA
ncbi:hypothetical protein SAY86_000326 [Trapa natans]|uniref:Uncharacterized protein n=1 Tax=Trapa natans TaxID=22666 RepID=A0AAN7M3U6_TRANT|nr:hypothetical protein SAY86_000326 [Trapa natans]